MPWLKGQQVAIATLAGLKSGQWSSLKTTSRPDLLVIVTGVGLGRSAAAIHWVLNNLNPTLVLNLGTAAAVLPKQTPLGSWVQPDLFLQQAQAADDEQPPLRADETIAPPDWPSKIARQKGGSLLSVHTPQYSGTQTFQSSCAFIDMEAYPQARACYGAKVPFASWKYLTDDAGADAATQYKSRLEALKDDIREIFSSWIS